MKNCEVDCDEMRNEIKNLKLEIAVLKNQVELKSIENNYIIFEKK